MLRIPHRFAAALALCVAGCGGGGGNDGAAQGASPGLTPTAVTPVYREYLGPLHQRTTLMEAVIESYSVDGIATALPPDLQPMGRVVHRRTTRPGYISVDIQHAVIGPIAAIDTDRGKIEVLGQDVYVLDQTWSTPPWAAGSFRPDLDALRVGDTVAVSGAFTADGDVYATYLSRVEPGTLLVRGVLTPGSGGRLRIGDLDVDLGTAALDGFPASAPLPGDTVLLTAAGAWSGGPLVARTARSTSRDWKVDATPTEQKTLVGFVTAARSPTDFDVAGYRVDLASCGCPILSATPAVGTPVTIQLEPFNTPGAASLNLVTWRTDVVLGPIESIDLTKRTVTVLGTTAEILPATYVVNGEVPGWALPGPEENLVMPLWARGTLSDFAVGDRVTVIGGARDGHFIAGGLLRLPAGYGPMILTSRRALNANTLRFFGQEVQMDTQTRVSDCRHSPCQPLTLTSFFNLAAGQYFPPILDILLDSATPPLRAQSISVRWQD
jgi:hypothetical protein